MQFIEGQPQINLRESILVFVWLKYGFIYINPYLNSVILFIKESIHHPKRTKAIEKWGLIFYKIRVIHFSYYLSHFTHFTPPPKEDKDNGKMRFLKYYLNSHNILQNSYNNFFLLFISLYLVISPHCPMRITSMRKWAFLKYYLSSHYILQNSHYTFFFFFFFFCVSLYSFHPTA